MESKSKPCSVKPYQYRPLEKNEFTRVIHLHPNADRASPLRCDLKHQPQRPKRFQTLSYDALSYAWGPPVFTETLLCSDDDEVLKITPSLGGALRALRLPSEKRELWVDAVCINQQDTDEKSAQVRAMSDIYRHARHVIAWVGDERDDAAKVLKFLHDYKELASVESYVSGGASRWRDDGTGGQAVSVIEKAIRETFPDTGLEPFRKFFQRPWFSRRWIIQEVVLAREPIIRCGSVSMDFGYFAGRASAMNLFVELHRKISHPLDPVFLMPDHMTQMLSSIASNNHTRNWKGMTTAGYKFPILSLLRDFQATQCSDDRDRIYALLGLSDNLVVAKPEEGHEDEGAPAKRQRRSEPELAVNYDHGAEQVYISLVTKLTERSYWYGLVELLGTASAFRSSSPCASGSKVPSWVPDWRETLAFEPVIEPDNSIAFEEEEEEEDDDDDDDDNDDDYDSDDDGSVSARRREILDDGKLLSLPGWKYTTVSERVVGGNLTADYTKFQDIKDTIQQWWTHHSADHGPPDPPKSIHDQDWYRHFFDLVVMGRTYWDGNGVYPPREFTGLLFEGALPDAWTDRRPPLYDGDGDGESVSPGLTETLLLMRLCTKKLAAMLRGRCLFRSGKGQLMNCPAGARVGDVVAVFKDVGIPYVIRPVEGGGVIDSGRCDGDGRTGRSERYRLVGDAYVDGIMEYRGAMDEELKPRKLTKEELGDVVAFLIE